MMGLEKLSVFKGEIPKNVKRSGGSITYFGIRPKDDETHIGIDEQGFVQCKCNPSAEINMFPKPKGVDYYNYRLLVVNNFVISIIEARNRNGKLLASYHYH